MGSPGQQQTRCGHGEPQSGVETEPTQQGFSSPKPRKDWPCLRAGPQTVFLWGFVVWGFFFFGGGGGGGEQFYSGVADEEMRDDGGGVPSGFIRPSALPSVGHKAVNCQH